MTSLVKTADDDLNLPESMRSTEFTGAMTPGPALSPASAGEPSPSNGQSRPRRPRVSATAARAEVEALLALDPAAAASTLTRYVDRLSTSCSFLLWASGVFAELARANPAGGLPGRTLTTDAWATLLCTVVLKPSDDDVGLQQIDRLEQLHELVRRFDPPIGYTEQYDTALESFAGSGPRSALAAANLLTATNPSLALQLAEGSDDSLGRVLVCASAHCELGQFEPAAHLFDRLERWGHGPIDLNLDDRFAWVLAMTETGRFSEAEQVCGETLGRLRLLRAAIRGGMGVDAGRDDDPTGHWEHVYCVQAGRLAHLQGRFAEG